jgi:hypothetical protein
VLKSGVTGMPISVAAFSTAFSTSHFTRGRSTRHSPPAP